MRPGLMAISLLAAQAAHAADLYVGPSQPYTTIAGAVGAAGPGDVIWLDPGAYDEAVVIGLGGDLTIQANGGTVTWTSPSGAEILWVDNAIAQIIGIDFDGTLVRRAITATTGATVTVDGCTFTQGRSTIGGGAIYAAASTIDIVGSDFTDNVVQLNPYPYVDADGGAIYGLDSAITVDTTTFTSNQALDPNSFGGAIYAAGMGSLTVTDSVFTANAAPTGEGGAIAADLVDTTISTSMFTLNAAWDGGAVACAASPQCDVWTCVFDQNTADDDAAAIQTRGSVAAIERTLFCDNTASLTSGNGVGGGFKANDASTVTATNNVFANNGAFAGGAMAMENLSFVDLVNNTVVGNNATLSGSAIYSEVGSTVTTRNDIFAYGVTGVSGYAVYDDDFVIPLEYALFFANSDFDHNGQVGTGVQLGVDPLLNVWPVSGCSWGDYTLQLGSPAIDMGDPDPAYDDVDGTRNDIGALGGPSAPLDLFVDADLDGWYDFDDCDDSDPAVNPGATELCDGGLVDEDCDGLIDNQDDVLGNGIPAWPDQDGDGEGDYWTPAQDRCDDGTVVFDNTDCDDANAYVQDGPIWFQDADGDGLGDPAVFMDACEQPYGYVANDSDCDDTDIGIGLAPIWYPDADGDGEGSDLGLGTPACTQPYGMVDNFTDCDDADPNNFSGNLEVCDGQDNDCDTLVDQADPSLDLGTIRDWYLDADGDGVGAGAPTNACTPPANHVDIDGDCDDADPLAWPGNAESCDSIDNDCDGYVDEDALDAPIWYVDLDNDGFGNPFTATPSCTQLPQTVPADGDCDDNDPAVNPGATEVCDGIDNDCDFEIDVGAIDEVVWYIDGDGDGYAMIDNDSYIACTAPPGTTDVLGDCDDDRAEAYPGAPELCNFDDEDCDDLVDEDLPTQPYFPDLDGDGFGDETAASEDFCGQPQGYSSDDTDCDDTSDSVYPGAPEIAGNGVDEDCDGLDTSLDSSRGWDGGETTETGPPKEIGCRCSSASGAAPLGWLVLPLIALRRRGSYS